jgi:hypothetical protein
MAYETPTADAPEAADQPTMAHLIKGILDDAMTLMRQQLAMFKAELRNDAKKLSYGLIFIACGIAPLLLGGLMMCFCLVHVLHWATQPAGSDPATIPLWGCYAIVSGAFLLIGGSLLGIGIYRLKSVNLLPDESARALEENVKWLMNPK